MRIKRWTNYMKFVVSLIEYPFEGRAVKFYLVMPHPSSASRRTGTLLKEKELPSEPLRDLA
jgi:hypothetical protein